MSKLIQRSTGKTIFEIIGGEKLTLDEAIQFSGIIVLHDDNDDRDGYFYDDLDYIVG